MYRRGKLSDIFGEFIVFRELNPVSRSLPQFTEIKKALSLRYLPRKKDEGYVKALSYIFSRAGYYKKIFYIGDTLMSDGSVIGNFVGNSDFETFGIITQESKEEKIEERENFIFNTHWRNLPEVIKMARENGFLIDRDTVFVIDIDKTAIGARGRNDKAIDKARMDAILEIAEDIFNYLDKDKFFDIYNAVNKEAFFYITSDNQDIVSVVSMLIYGGAVSVESLKETKDTLAIFEYALKNAKGKLKEVAVTVYENIKNGNPTAFPLFRKTEFKKTIERMDFLKDEADVKTLLSEEIMITGEVYAVATEMRKRGTLVFGVSDKPMYSSVPLGGSNLPAIYEKEMKIYSER